MKSGLVAFAVLSFAVLSYVAYAQSGPSMIVPVVTQPANNTTVSNDTIVTHVAFQAAMQQIVCRNNFTINFITDLANFGVSSLSQYATTLQNDQTQLQTYVDNSDVKGFRSFLKSTYETDFKQAKQAVESQIKTNNFTLSEKLSLKSSWQQLKSDYESCNFGALKTYAQQKVDTYAKLLDNYRQRANNFGTKTGVDISTLTQIINGANTLIVQPMQSAIDAATDSASLKDATKAYCLFDGCNDGVNYHLAARYEAQRLTLVLGLIESKANTTSYESQISQAHGTLNSVESQVGDNKWLSDSEMNQLWSDIKSAGQTIKGIISSILGG